MLRNYRWTLSVLCLLALSAPRAHAQHDDVTAAANAFSQAQRAELNGEHARAAELYELADSIAPAPEALRNATRAWLAAEQPVSASLAAEELLRRYSADPASRELAEQVLARTQPELARFAVRCSDPCSLVVNGLATATGARANHIVYVRPGPHTLVARFEDGSSRNARVSAQAGAAQGLELTRPPATESHEPAVLPNEGEHSADDTRGNARATEAQAASPRARLSPAYFWSAASVTLALGAVTVWSGIDLLRARDDFRSEPTQRKFDAGEDKDVRTGALIGSTAVCALVTAGLGYFTNWHGPSRESSAALTLDVHPQAWRVGLEGRF